MKIPLEAVVKELLSRDRNQRWRKTLIKKKRVDFKGLSSPRALLCSWIILYQSPRLFLGSGGYEKFDSRLNMLA